MADAGHHLPSPIRLAVREAATQVGLFWRTPMQAVFLAGLPLTLVPLLHALNKNVFVDLPGSPALGAAAPYDQYLVPVMAAFGIASACFATLAIRITVARETGALKRLHSTPLPASSHLVGRIAAAVSVGAVIAAATVTLGAAAYDVEVVAARLPAALVAAVVGAASFCALGMAMTRLLPSAEAAPGIVLAVLLPVGFLSNVFFPPELAPAWMRTAGSWLPLAPLARAMAVAFNPGAAETLSTPDVARLAAWGVAGAIVAGRTFRWSPAQEYQRPSRVRGRPRPAVPKPVLVAVTATLVGLVLWQLVSAEADSLTRRLGPIGEFDEAASIVTVAVPRSVYDGAWSSSPLAVLAAGEPTIDLAVIRTGSDLTVLTARSPVAGCPARPVAELDPAWVAAIDPTGGAVLADPCSGWAYSTNGTCLTDGCSTGLFVVPARLEDQTLVVELDQLPLAPAGSVGEPPPDLPGPRATTYQAAGTIRGQAAPAAVSLVWDDLGLHVVADGADFTTADLVTLATPARVGGVLTGVAIDGAAIPELTPVEPLTWLALRPETEATARDTLGGGTITMRRVDANTWVLSGTGAELHFTTGEGVFPWPTITVTGPGLSLALTRG